MNKKNKLSWILLIPTIIIMVGLVFYPIIVTFSYSLKYFKLTEPENERFIGLENYSNVLKDPEFIYSLKNTLVILFTVIIISVIMSLLISLILNRDTKISGFLTAIAILPWALPPIVNGIIWKWIFYPGFGLANKFLIKLGFISEPIQWTVNRWTLLILISIVLAWRIIPFCSIIFLSALQSVPKEIYESASIDGAGKVYSFFKITLPLLLPSFAMVLTHTSIGAINVFDEI
ncbi:MAG: sugar ABC transporter permease, partial [Andreesenia angusta]|nr:sugar ABC transporter permease [Andreesenia angusta]